MKKYNREDRLKLHKRIRELLRGGLKHDGVVNALNTEGFRTPSGDPVNKRMLANQIHKFKLSKRLRIPRVTGTVTANVLTPSPRPSLLQYVLTHPKLNDSAKFRIAGILSEFSGI